MVRAWLLTGGVVLAATLSGITPASAQSTPPTSCGMTVTSNVAEPEVQATGWSLLPTASPWIRGHVRAVGIGTGVNVTGHHGVHIVNGTVSRFATGLFVNQFASDGTIGSRSLCCVTVRGNGQPGGVFGSGASTCHLEEAPISRTRESLRTRRG